MNVKIDMKDINIIVNVDKPLKVWIDMLVKEHSYPAVKGALEAWYANNAKEYEQELNRYH
jgi:hypothetical protein